MPRAGLSKQPFRERQFPVKSVRSILIFSRQSMEQGRGNPTVATLAAIAQACGVTFGDLCSGV